MTSSGNMLPDAPFKSGASGKYKLLVKSVIHKLRYFEYMLTDSEEREYKAVSNVHYAENSILRCMITFKIERAKFVVSATAICGKQDLTTPITVPKKEKDLSTSITNPAQKDVVVIHTTPTKKNLPTIIQGCPSVVERTGLYLLTVKTSQSWNRPESVKAKYIYHLQDKEGKEYYALSNVSYGLNRTALCKVEVLKGNKILYFSAFYQDNSSIPVGIVDGAIIPRHHYIWSPVPTRVPSKKNDQKKKPATSTQKMATLFGKYEKRERYNFTVTGESDYHGNQILKDASGRLHLLTGTETRYEIGDEVRCTVLGFGNRPVGPISGQYLVLSEPRIVKKVTTTVRYVKGPERWYSEVQGLGKHKCGKAFRCSCCGRDFPANAGWRVDLKDIYFCNSCARMIYEPVGRGNRHFYISTPMGNKR